MTTLGYGRIVSAHVTYETNFGLERIMTPDEELAVVVLASAILDFLSCLFDSD